MNAVAGRGPSRCLSQQAPGNKLYLALCFISGSQPSPTGCWWTQWEDVQTWIHLNFFMSVKQNDRSFMVALHSEIDFWYVYQIRFYLHCSQVYHVLLAAYIVPPWYQLLHARFKTTRGPYICWAIPSCYHVCEWTYFFFLFFSFLTKLIF